MGGNAERGIYSPAVNVPPPPSPDRAGVDDDLGQAETGTGPCPPRGSVFSASIPLAPNAQRLD